MIAQETIEHLCAGMSIAAEYKGRQTEEDWESDRWDVTLTYQGRTLTTPYRMGTGLSKPHPSEAVRGESVYEYERRKARPERWKPTQPDAASVLDSLLADVSGLDQSFEGWASDLGFDPDSRKAERIHIECLKVLPRLHALLGADFGRFEQAERL